MVLFRLKDRRSSSKSILISSDLENDNKIDSVIREKFRGNIQSCMTSRIEYDHGQYGSLLALSATPRDSISADDLAILQDISKCVESTINAEELSSWDTSRSNLSLCSGLLSCLKPSLHELTTNFFEIKETWDSMNHFQALPALSLSSPRGTVDRYKRRLLLKIERIEFLLAEFGSNQKSVVNSVERILQVAKSYFLKDKEQYIKSCSEMSGIGLVEKINKCLKQLSEKLPSNSILWCFKIDNILAHCAHRTFYYHLMLFLENIIFYWSRYCSTTQMFIVFEPVERNELPVRIPNLLKNNPTAGSNPNNQENNNDYAYVIEGFIKVLLQFPDKNHRFGQSGDENDDASVGSSYYSGIKSHDTRTATHVPLRPGSHQSDRSNQHGAASLMSSPTRPAGNYSVASPSVAIPPTVVSGASTVAKNIGHNNFVSGSQKSAGFQQPNIPIPENIQTTNLLGRSRSGDIFNSSQKGAPEDENDPNHPVHHIEPLLQLLNSSLFRLSEVSTAKTVNVLSESMKKPTDEAYFIRIPCLLYLTSSMDTSFLQYHGYKYNDFRFQIKKKRQRRPRPQPGQNAGGGDVARPGSSQRMKKRPGSGGAANTDNKKQREPRKSIVEQIPILATIANWFTPHSSIAENGDGKKKQRRDTKFPGRFDIAHNKVSPLILSPSGSSDEFR